MSFRRIRTIVFWITVYTGTVSSGQTASDNFVIDDANPYVYIKFDHFGPRTPVNETESTKGMWLRLTNNCRLPISVSVLNPGTGDPGVILNYAVVPTPRRFAPNARQKSSMPSGYSADIGTLETLPPKGDLLFSVPAESIAEHWYIQVRFRFVLPKPKVTVETQSGNYDPYSIVDFTWYNIPEETRRVLRVPVGNPMRDNVK